MALPTVTIDNVNGSNTAASGAGPSTALSGTGAATAASTAVDLSADAPNLSGVATDGSAVLWVQSSSGRQFSKITAANNSTKVVTVANAYANTESGKLWGIGGKRKDFETTNANTKQLFLDALAGWTIDILETGTSYVLTSTITVSAGGDATNGPCVIKSSSTSRPKITSATNSVDLFSIIAAGSVEFRHLWLTHTAGTRGGGFIGSTTGSSTGKIADCLIDGCWRGIVGGNRWPFTVETTTVQNCTSIGVSFSGGITMSGCMVRGCAAGVAEGSGDPGTSYLYDTIIAGSTGIGFELNNAARGYGVWLSHCTIANNGSHGIGITAASGQGFVNTTGSAYYGNGGYGIYVPNNTALQSQINASFNAYNAYGGNTSGDHNGYYDGVGKVTLTADPFVDAASGDFNINNTAGGGALLRAVTYDLPG